MAGKSETTSAALAKQIDYWVEELLHPMVSAMAMGRWPANMQATMWEAIAGKAAKRAREAYKR